MMFDQSERQFRVAERQLDDLVRQDEAALTASGITFADESARTYHYKNHYLSWHYRFETRHERGHEIEKVQVRLRLDEMEVALLHMSTHAEIFQLGQLPRWTTTTEDQLPLPIVLPDGLYSLVSAAIRSGQAAAAKVT